MNQTRGKVAVPIGLRILAIGLGAALSACGTMRLDQGAARPSTEIAVLENSDSGSVIDIDGRSVDQWLNNKYEVNAGIHIVEFEYWVHTDYFFFYFASRRSAQIKFSAEAGKHYSFHGAETAEGQHRDWVQEEPSGKIVVGTAPR